MWTRRASYTGLLLAAACGPATASPEPARVPPAASGPSAGEGRPAGWLRFEAEDFSIDAPAPLTASASCPDPSILVHTWSWSWSTAPAGDPRYAVVRLDFSSPLSEIVDRTRSRFEGLLPLAPVGAQPASVDGRSVEVDGARGRDYQLAFGTDAAGVLRELWVGDSLYLVAVVGPPPHVPPMAQVFLDSFHLRPSGRRVSLRPPVIELEVPRAARRQESSNADTTLTDFFVGEREVCRVFDTPVQAAPDGAAPPGATERAVLDHIRSGGTLSAARDVRSDDGSLGLEADFVRSSNKVPERIRVHVAAGHAYILSAPLGADGTLAPDAARCLRSFRLADPHGPCGGALK